MFDRDSRVESLDLTKPRCKCNASFFNDEHNPKEVFGFRRGNNSCPKCRLFPWYPKKEVKTDE